MLYASQAKTYMPFTKIAIPIYIAVWNRHPMNMATSMQLTARGFALDASEEAFGELRSSIDIADDVDALRERIQEDGYLYLPGYLDREEVIEARREITRRLAAAGCLHPDHDPMEAVVHPEY